MTSTAPELVTPGALSFGAAATGPVQVPVIIVSRCKADHHWTINYNPEEGKPKQSSLKCKLGTQGLMFLKNIHWDIGRFFKVAAFGDGFGNPVQPLTDRDFQSGICQSQVRLLLPIIFGKVPDPVAGSFSIANQSEPPLWLVYEISLKKACITVEDILAAVWRFYNLQQVEYEDLSDLLSIPTFAKKAQKLMAMQASRTLYYKDLVSYLSQQFFNAAARDDPTFETPVYFSGLTFQFGTTYLVNLRFGDVD
ncbi:hypothetical protein HK102_001815 [Quaeritorhiza haematococci]|nr:hypothetical protein HK102_001815 [Quaeritorhiza haematococci]